MTMKATSQYELHPDAELLNAFAERALGPREREQVLSHLAACGRCRQVLALAREAADAGDAAPVAAAARPAREANAWWKQWRVVWVPTAVVAAFAVTSASVYLHQVNRRETAISVAKLTPAQGTQPASAPSVAEQLKAAPPVPAAPATKTANSKPPARTPGVREHLRLEPPAPPPPALPPAAENMAPRFPGTGFLAGRSPAIYESSATLAKQQAEKKEQDGMKPAAGTAAPNDRLFAAKTPPPAEIHGASAPLPAAGQSVAVSSAAPQPETRSAAVASFGALQAGLATRPFPPHPSDIIRLPSGLHAVSAASASKLMLAIDPDGALYISHDQGATWTRVPQQWTGRAVLVRRQPAPPTAATPPPEAQQQSNPAAEDNQLFPPATNFEIVNDKSQIWQSTDGRIWTPK